MKTLPADAPVLPAVSVVPSPVFLSGDVGERLVSAGAITLQQLQHAQREHKRRGVPLSKVLIELGMVAPDKISDILADVARARRVQISHFRLSPEAVALVPLETARRFRALPVSVSDGKLTVALADPANVIAIDTLTLITGHSIDVVTAPEHEILNALDRLEASGGTIQDTVDEIIDEREKDPYTAEKPEQVFELEPGMDAEAPTVRLVSQIIARAVETGASDIHFEPEEKLMRIRIRIDGVLHPDVLVPKGVQSVVVSRMKILADLDVSENRLPQDGRATVVVGRRQVNLRVSSLPTAHGESVVARILNQGTGLTHLSAVGMPPAVDKEMRRIIDEPHGVVVVTGPTGSGKTTTLYALLAEINSTEYSIFTLEDPIEIRLQGLRQTQVKEEIGLTFSAGLRSLLRQDPDVILVGETRDTETAQLMVRASLTGHLVFTTLHTNDAPGAIPRMLDMGVEPFLLPDSLLGVLAQRLVRRLCPRCREPLENPEKVFDDLKLAPPAGMPVQLWKSSGCSVCSNTGFKGRQGIFELMVIDGGFHDAIVRRSGAHEFARLARDRGMQTMFEDGLRLAVEGTTTIKELLRVTRLASSHEAVSG